MFGLFKLNLSWVLAGLLGVLIVGAYLVLMGVYAERNTLRATVSTLQGDLLVARNEASYNGALLLDLQAHSEAQQVTLKRATQKAQVVSRDSKEQAQRVLSRGIPATCAQANELALQEALMMKQVFKDAPWTR